MDARLELLRLALRLSFAVTGLLVLAALVGLSVYLWDRMFPGLPGALDSAMEQRQGRGSGLLALLMVPLPLAGFYLWYRLFRSVDRRFDADLGPLAEAPAQARAHRIAPGLAAVCIYRKLNLAADAPIAFELDGQPLGETSRTRHVLRDIPPGPHTVRCGAPTEASLSLQAEAGTLYVICHEVRQGRSGLVRVGELRG